MKEELLKMCLILALLLTIVPVWGQVRSIGVNVGDWFKYDVGVAWNSTDPNATFPPHNAPLLKEVNSTEWMLIAVTNISYLTVSLQVTEHYRNGTEKIDSGNINVGTGGGKPQLLYKVISANLSVNDIVYTQHSPLRIDGIENRTYLDDTRETLFSNETLHMNITKLEPEPMNGTLDETTLSYWDRTTGILTKLLSYTVERIGNYTTTWSSQYELTESNRWTVPENHVALPVLLLTSLTYTIYAYKKNGKRSSRSILRR